MNKEPSDFPSGHDYNHFYQEMVMVKWSQLTDISTDFNNKIIWNCRNSHDQIWIDHFDRENLVTLLIVMVKFGLTTLTMSPQYGQLVKKSWSLNLL